MLSQYIHGYIWIGQPTKFIVLGKELFEQIHICSDKNKINDKLDDNAIFCYQQKNKANKHNNLTKSFSKLNDWSKCIPSVRQNEKWWQFCAMEKLHTKE